MHESEPAAQHGVAGGFLRVTRALERPDGVSAVACAGTAVILERLPACLNLAFGAICRIEGAHPWVMAALPLAALVQLACAVWPERANGWRHPMLYIACVWWVYVGVSAIFYRQGVELAAVAIALALSCGAAVVRRAR